MTEIIPGTIYQHYKGTKVKIICKAKHSETLEDMVVYTHLEDNQTCVRPKKMFLENAVIDGKEVGRFVIPTEA